MAEQEKEMKKVYGKCTVWKRVLAMRQLNKIYRAMMKANNG